MGDLVEMCSPGGNQGNGNFNDEFESELRQPIAKARRGTYVLWPAARITGPLITSTSNLSNVSPTLQQYFPFLVLLRRCTLASQTTLIPPISLKPLFLTVT